MIIPNADLCTATVINNTASPYRRQDLVVGVGYDTDLTHAREIALQVVRETPGVLARPEPDLLVDDLADSSVTLKLRFYTESRRLNSLTLGSAVRQRLKEAFDAAGITIPFPTQVMYLSNAPPAALARKRDAPAGAEGGPWSDAR